jgi:hypothetical protein
MLTIRKRQRRSVLALLLTLCAAASGAVAPTPAEAGDKEIIDRLQAAGRATVQRLRATPAAWTSVQRYKNGERVKVEITGTSTRRRIEFLVSAPDAEWQPSVSIIERDERWYVDDHGRRAVYRPFEAPLSLPVLYAALHYAEPQLLPDSAGKSAWVESRERPLITLRVPLSEVQSAREKAVADAFTASDSHADDAKLEELRNRLKNGARLVADESTGILVKFGDTDRHFQTNGFHWIADVPESTFRVDDQKWEDHSQPLADGNIDRLAMFGYAGSWEPGQRTGDISSILLDLDSGEIRQIPYVYGIASPGGFFDSSRIFLTGYVSGGALMAPFEVNLKTGANRQLGGDALAAGVTVSPALSPDKTKLAVWHSQRAPTEFGEKLTMTLHLIDVRDGVARPVGTPQDAAYLSWLPDGLGLLTALTERPRDRPAESWIMRISLSDSLSGTLTRMFPGDEPVVLPELGRVMFRHSGKWFTYSLDWKRAEQVGDGLPEFKFPSQARGTRVLMMKYGSPKGPRPYVVNVADGTSEPVPVKAEGLLTLPAW